MANISKSINPSHRSVWILDGRPRNEEGLIEEATGVGEGSLVIGAAPSASPGHRESHLNKLIELGVSDYVCVANSFEMKRHVDYKGYIQDIMAKPDGSGTLEPTFHEMLVSRNSHQVESLVTEVYNAALTIWGLIRQGKIVYLFDSGFDGRSALVAIYVILQQSNLEDDPKMKPGDKYVDNKGQEHTVSKQYVPRTHLEKKKIVVDNVKKQISTVQTQKKNLFTVQYLRVLSGYDKYADAYKKWQRETMIADLHKKNLKMDSNGKLTPINPDKPFPGKKEESSEESPKIISEGKTEDSRGKVGQQASFDTSEHRLRAQDMLATLLEQMKSGGEASAEKFDESLVADLLESIKDVTTTNTDDAKDIIDILETGNLCENSSKEGVDAKVTSIE